MGKWLILLETSSAKIEDGNWGKLLANGVTEWRFPSVSQGGAREERYGADC